MRVIVLLLTHATVAFAGFAAGFYVLPIVVAPEAPSPTDLEALEREAEYRGEFRRDLPGSDLLHWGEGRVAVSATAVSHSGRLAPGPDYTLYLAPEFVSTAAEFERVRTRSVRLGDVRSFKGFIMPVPGDVDVARYDTVVVWCEAFSQFITAARYR